MNKETLEEAAENYAKQFDYAEDSSPQLDFIEGAKWQAERMYSEEDVYHILCEHTAFLFAGGKSTLSEWFKKYKIKL
jgi:predicted SAM-dependent methyltransferase